MNKIVVVDLDGCLCKINSFRYWLLFTFLFFLFSFRWTSLMKFNKYIFLRIFRKSNRVEMKRDILSLTENMPRYFTVAFSGFLSLFVNRQVCSQIRRYENMNISVVLCTAAPSCYVHIFAEKFNFSQIFATPTISIKNWKENIGQEKWESVVSYYGNDVVLECVITDHHDDLPLLVHAKKRLLVGPTKGTLEAIKGHFDFDII